MQPASVQSWLEEWAPLAEWFVAVGTALLAVATFALARQTKSESSAVVNQVSLQREQLEAERRPLVYPTTPGGWLKQHPGGVPFAGFISLKNGGRGLATDVRGWVRWDDGVDAATWPVVKILPTTLAAGEEEFVRLEGAGVPRWVKAYGVIDYRDVPGADWRTAFEFDVDASGNLYVEVGEMNERALMGDPPERR